MQYIKIVGGVLAAGSLLLMVKCLFRKNEAFFNLRDVVKKHFELFKDCKTQYIVFYGLPALFAVGLSMIYSAAIDFYTELSVILGIILSVLLTVLSILSNYDFSTVEDEQQREKGKQVVENTINAITFNSLLCIFLLLYILVLVVLYSGDYSGITWDISIIKAAISAIAYYMFSVICLTLLLVIKQMSKIIQFNLKVKKGS